MIKTDEKKKHVKETKFYFDQNNFDDDYEEEVEEEEPPPPTFSEDELALAQKKSFEQGKREGLAEAQASREKQVANLIATITTNFQTLFDAENERAAKYETEALVLSKAIFTKLFPHLNESKGLDEVFAVINSVLETQKEQSEIIIETNPEFVDSIENRLKESLPSIAGQVIIQVIGAGDLGAGDCRMSWKDGGAARNADFLAGEIHRQLEHMLADQPLLHDNSENKAQITEPENNDDPDQPAQIEDNGDSE